MVELRIRCTMHVSDLRLRVDHLNSIRDVAQAVNDGNQAVRQLDQLRIGLGSFGAFYVGHFFLNGGSVLPNDRLHKIYYTLERYEELKDCADVCIMPG